MQPQYRRKRTLTLLAESLVPSPDAADERFFHDDLPHKSADELKEERRLLQLRLLLERSHPSWWHQERLQRIAKELARVR